MSKYSEEEAYIEYFKKKEEKLTKIDYLIMKVEKLEKIILEVSNLVSPS
tara:strand:- start:482 stop:628 length:147 start_codon:yes stop_codon:yes gene_type:complete